MFELRGIVTKIVKNDYEDELVIFKVKRGETIYTCRYNGCLPLDTNDTISLKGQLYDYEILVGEKPFVLITYNVPSVQIENLFAIIKLRMIFLANVNAKYSAQSLTSYNTSPTRESKQDNSTFISFYNFIAVQENTCSVRAGVSNFLCFALFKGFLDFFCDFSHDFFC